MAREEHIQNDLQCQPLPGHRYRDPYFVGLASLTMLVDLCHRDLILCRQPNQSTRYLCGVSLIQSKRV